MIQVSSEGRELRGCLLGSLQIYRKFSKATEALSHSQRSPISPRNGPASESCLTKPWKMWPLFQPVMVLKARKQRLEVRYGPHHWRSEAILMAPRVPTKYICSPVVWDTAWAQVTVTFFILSTSLPWWTTAVSPCLYISSDTRRI